MHAARTRRGLLLCALATCSLILSGTSAWATNATLIGGEGSLWTATDTLTTTNARSTGGKCTQTVGGGDALIDAMLEGQGDAFDGAAMVFTDDLGQLDGQGTFTSNEAIFAGPTGSGVTRQLKYRALPDQAVLRVLVRLTNNDFTPRGLIVEYVNNLGSDLATQVTGVSSSGHGGRWIVTDDGSTTAGDPANTTVFMGPGDPDALVRGSLDNVFECSGTQGTYAGEGIEIPAREMVTLMFFQQLNPSSAEALADAAQFDTTPAFGSPLTLGLTPDEYRTLINWDVPPDCADGRDNDGDGSTDFPADQQCDSASDRHEGPQCSDGLDNDRDGWGADFPDDPGCTGATDNTEDPNPQCSDRMDNDSDGLIDFEDEGCTSERDNSEVNAQCNDGVDNDGDGLVDHPADPGCTSLTDNKEVNPRCNDGVDNDGDGLVDHPADPGCTSLTDNKEVNPRCNDGVDNDGDGLVDYPDDPGCTRLRDNTE